MVVVGFRSFHVLVFTESRRHARRRRIQDCGVIDFRARVWLGSTLGAESLVSILSL